MLNTCQTFYAEPKKIVSGNAGDEKNLHPGGRKFIFFNWFSGDTVFSFLVSFAFYVFLFFCLFLCFLKLTIYILIHIWLCGWVSDKKFSPGRFPETTLLFMVHCCTSHAFHIPLISALQLLKISKICLLFCQSDCWYFVS